MAVFAFESRASNVLIRNVTIEKYASVAQKGDQIPAGSARGACERSAIGYQAR